MTSANRGSKTIVNTTLFSDRRSAQLKTYSKNHQLCLIHFLRDLNFLEELEKHSVDVPEAILLEKKLNKRLVATIDAKKYPKATIFQRLMIKIQELFITVHL